ncbi:MAG: glycine--tRNA ligase [Gemmataceae bacterium]|nr:glycine--tRNA ligase [Gemmataceae bacterium]
MDMEKVVALCKRRGFIFQSSEIYGGLNGFWDYGPLGVELKRNIKEAWWRDHVTGHDDIGTPAGAPSSYQMVGLDCSIIMHPQVWKCSGHYDLFHDYMVDCRESKKRYRVDQVVGRWAEAKGRRIFPTVVPETDDPAKEIEPKALKFFDLRAKQADQVSYEGTHAALSTLSDFSSVLGPDAKTLGTLTPPREFNLMFKTIVGAMGGEDDAAFLRPETAQGIFVNFKNVVDSTRVKVPFGIAQVGKSFRNEITPRNFTFRSREFEQMEIEFFCPPDDSAAWYRYWRDTRYAWYLKLGLSKERLRMREHEAAELAHYSVGTADIEYAFPFLPPGEFGELEGVAHRADFDLRSHTEGKLVKQGSELVVETADGKPRHKGSGKNLQYLDQLTNKKYFPHVIEPSAGADRATLAFLCEAYCEDEAPNDKGAMEKRVVLKLHPRLAPIKAAIFPLFDKEGMPEIAQKLYLAMKKRMNVQYDDGGGIGKRYRRHDEIGTPFCVTVDHESLKDGAATVRDRDTLKQERVKLEEIPELLRKRVEGE